MAVGAGIHGGGLASETDVFDAGASQWSRVSGISPHSPLVGGDVAGGLQAGNPVLAGTRIVTTPQGQMGGAAEGVAATPDGIALLDSWRDLFNFTGSPMPWLFVASLIVLGLMQLRVSARTKIGPASVNAALG